MFPKYFKTLFGKDGIKTAEVYSFLSHLSEAEALVEMNPEYRKYMSRTRFSINNESRVVLFQQPDAAIFFRDVVIPEKASLKFGIGINEKAWDQDSHEVKFEIIIEDQRRQRSILFSRSLDPKRKREDRRWFDFEMDLSAYSNSRLSFIFKTSLFHPTPAYRIKYDWPAWSEMEILSDGKPVYRFRDNIPSSEILDLKAFYVKEAPFVINDDMRGVLFQHPNSVVIYRDVPLFKKARLQFGIGMRPTAWDKGGGSVIFEIEVMSRRGEVKRVYQRGIDPKRNPDHRKWFDEEIDLKEFNGQSVTFFFKTRSPSLEDRVASWVGWSWPRVISEGKTPQVKKGGDQPNILLITIDTLRADHLGCYGKKTIRTPLSDRLAAEGVRFNQVYSQSHITSPSHLALLTSKYPIRHIRDNNPCIVSPELKNMAHLLQRRGYTTLGIVSVELFNPYWCVNIDRDFQYYYPVRGNNRIGAQGRDIFHDWLKDHYSKGFFGWIHLFDPHAPYIPPPSHYKMYYKGDEKRLSETSMREAEFPAFFKDNVAWLKDVTDIAFPMAQYAAEVSYVDSLLGDILSDLDHYGLLDRTLIILTSDHGESFTEHDIFFDHQGLYDPVIHIPLIMRYPSKLPAGRLIESLAMSIDILPTVFDLLGYEIPGDIDGKSLLPLVQGEVRDVHDAVFSEHVDGTQLMVRTRKWKYIQSLKDWHYTRRFSIKKGEIELYDLEGDPEESKNVAVIYPETAQELDLRLAQWLREHSEGPLAERVAGDREIVEKLKSLGYF